MPEYEKTEDDKKYDQLVKEIAAVLNRHSVENRSNTPDFMLAEFMLGVLNVYENTLRNREQWRSR
jgi:uncharacterized protein YejL (UPF0352 family)